MVVQLRQEPCGVPRKGTYITTPAYDGKITEEMAFETFSSLGHATATRDSFVFNVMLLEFDAYRLYNKTVFFMMKAECKFICNTGKSKRLKLRYRPQQQNVFIQS